MVVCLLHNVIVIVSCPWCMYEVEHEMIDTPVIVQNTWSSLMGFQYDMPTWMSGDDYNLDCCSCHGSYLLDLCSSVLYALRVLRSYGFSSQSLKDVFHAMVIDRMMYWHGFCLAFDYTRLNSFLRRTVKLDYYDKHSATANSDLFQEADNTFFWKILCNKAHILHTFYLTDPILYTLSA